MLKINNKQHTNLNFGSFEIKGAKAFSKKHKKIISPVLDEIRTNNLYDGTLHIKKNGQNFTAFLDTDFVQLIENVSENKVVKTIKTWAKELQGNIN